MLSLFTFLTILSTAAFTGSKASGSSATDTSGNSGMSGGGMTGSTGDYKDDKGGKPPKSNAYDVGCDDSRDVLELKLLTYQFQDAYSEYLNSNVATEFVEEGVIFAPGATFCEASTACTTGVQSIETLLKPFQEGIDLSFENVKFLGVNPTSPLRPVIVQADEVVKMANGCEITLPGRIAMIYFDENDLVTQYHVSDTNNKALEEFFTLFGQDSC